MAAKASPEDYTCPVCCDIFKDPVVLLCGHSFCRYCLREWWRQSGSQTCPVCKEIFPLNQPPCNLALRNLSDTLRQERVQKAAVGCKDFCSLHGEKLKLFCQEDEQLICVICRDAKQHKKHNCAPVNEVAEDHRTKLKVGLMHLNSKRESFKAEKLKCEKMAGHITLQAQQTEKAIKAEFQKLYQFLRADEAARIDAVRREAAVKSDAMKIRIMNLNADILTLISKIKTIQQEMKAEDISFMLNVKSTLERSECKLPEPETPSGALINEAKHLGNLLFKVWGEMKQIIQYTPVTLDPNTSVKSISEQLTRLTEDWIKPRPDNPERGGCWDVLGSEGFSSGKHSWDVELAGFWWVGVTTRQGYETKWGIYHCPCSSILRDFTDDPVEAPVPRKVRVQLNYERGILSFLDLDRKTVVHTVKHAFTGPVFPYFREAIKILPTELLVTVRKPSVR